MADRLRNIEPSQTKGVIVLKEPETVSWSRVSTTRKCDCCRLWSPHLVAGKRACRRFNLPRIFIVSRMLRGGSRGIMEGYSVSRKVWFILVSILQMLHLLDCVGVVQVLGFFKQACLLQPLSVVTTMFSCRINPSVEVWKELRLLSTLWLRLVGWSPQL